MTDRLLEETTALLPGQNGGHSIVRCESILRLQDAKSIKVDREAMARWLESLTHRRTFNYDTRQVSNSSIGLLREGKAPWEEKDAVLETRKTPRTIPPD